MNSPERHAVHVGKRAGSFALRLVLLLGVLEDLALLPGPTDTPPAHCATPKTHSPTSLPQAPPPPGLPSSATPSQLLSRLSQISADGGSGVQVCTWPSEQLFTVT